MVQYSGNNLINERTAGRIGVLVPVSNFNIPGIVNRRIILDYYVTYSNEVLNPEFAVAICCGL
jgi:hypothetical protein